MSVMHGVNKEHLPATAGIASIPPGHSPTPQSSSFKQALPSAHLGQAPPQSTSVSSPPFLPSVHDVHLNPRHLPIMQSRSLAQTRPSAHLGHVPPPQSTSVSVPF